MPEYLGFGEVGAQALQQFGHRPLLRCRARVGRLAAGVDAALVAYAEAVGVVVLGVGSDHLLGTAWMYHAVAGDVVVVAGGAEAARLVARLEGFCAEAAVSPGG